MPAPRIIRAMDQRELEFAARILPPSTLAGVIAIELSSNEQTCKNTAKNEEKRHCHNSEGLPFKEKLAVGRFKLSKMITKILLIASTVFGSSIAFQGTLLVPSIRTVRSSCPLSMVQQQVTEGEARKGIDKVVNALRRDKDANEELGRLDKVTVVLGYGAPNPGSLNLRFNASFRKAGKGMMAVPMPFMLGQTNKSEGRGQMVGQVKASVDTKSGKCIYSIFYSTQSHLTPLVSTSFVLMFHLNSWRRKSDKLLRFQGLRLWPFIYA